MNAMRQRNRRFTMMSLALVSALLLSAFVNVGQASAEEGNPPEPGQIGDRIDERLEAYFERLNDWFAFQEGNIGRAKNAVDRIEGMLAKAEEHGIDTSKIEALMPSLYTAVGRAESAHANAREILGEHNGFNGGGKVKDRQQALETCRSSREALGSAKNSLLEARGIVKEIVEIAKTLRDKHLPAAAVTDGAG